MNSKKIDAYISYELHETNFLFIYNCSHKFGNTANN